MLWAWGAAADSAFAELPEEIGARFADVQRAVRDGRSPELRETAHRLAGLAEHFGLAQVAAACRRLEGAAPRNADPTAEASRLAEALATIDWGVYAVEPDARRTADVT